MFGKETSKTQGRVHHKPDNHHAPERPGHSGVGRCVGIWNTRCLCSAHGRFPLTEAGSARSAVYSSEGVTRRAHTTSMSSPVPPESVESVENARPAMQMTGPLLNGGEKVVR